MKDFIKRYQEYLADNPEGYWFKRKLYGWGWTPAKPAGWITLGVYLVALIVGLRHFESTIGVEAAPLRFLFFAFALTMLLLIVTWRTGEPPKWQWGLPKANESEAGEEQSS